MYAYKFDARNANPDQTRDDDGYRNAFTDSVDVIVVAKDLVEAEAKAKKQIERDSYKLRGVYEMHELQAVSVY